jgi:hypothetical protein
MVSYEYDYEYGGFRFKYKREGFAFAWKTPQEFLEDRRLDLCDQKMLESLNKAILLHRTHRLEAEKIRAQSIYGIKTLRY